MKNSHPCIQGKMKQDCPVCMEDMHTSVQGTTFLRCGHSMHVKCFNKYIKSNQIACPMCKKSIVDPKFYEQHIDLQIAQMQMPEEYKDTKMVVMCNDCLKRSTVPFHILGGKCKHCRSYNTTRVEEEAQKEEDEVVEENEANAADDNEDDWEDQN